VVFGTLLSHISSLSQVPALLQAYQDLRCVAYPPSALPPSLPRTHNPSFTHRTAHLTHNQKQVTARVNNARVLAAQPKALPPARRTRAARWRPSSRGASRSRLTGNPNQWADRTESRIQFGYDAYAEVERWWTAGGRERIEALAGARGSDGDRAGMMVKARL